MSSSPQIQLLEEGVVIKNASSEPNIPTQLRTGGADAGTSSNITTRQNNKRRRVSDESISNEIGDLKNLVTSFMENQNSRFTVMENLILEIKAQNSSIPKIVSSVDNLSSQIKTMDENILGLEQQRRNMATQITDLQSQIEYVDLNAVKTCVEIRNVPKTQSESQDMFMSMLFHVSKIIGCQITHADIRDTFRVPPKPDKKQSTIVFEFQSTRIKFEFLKAAKHYNKTHTGEVLNSSHLGLDGMGNAPIFISERLTAKTRKLYYQAREFCKSESYTHCWVSRGKVYLRKKEGSPHIQVKNEAHMQDLKQTQNNA